MLQILDNLLPHIYHRSFEAGLWDSLVIDRRHPKTHRMFSFFEFGGKSYRVCLHEFQKCHGVQAFEHPHSGPAAFLILQGEYIQEIGVADSVEHPPIPLYKEILRPGSRYEITNKLLWHKIIPTETTYTIMVNGKDYENPHDSVRRTDGKDLKKMPVAAQKEHLKKFQHMIGLVQVEQKGRI